MQYQMSFSGCRVIRGRMSAHINTIIVCMTSATSSQKLEAAVCCRQWQSHQNLFTKYAAWRNKTTSSAADDWCCETWSEAVAGTLIADVDIGVGCWSATVIDVLSMADDCCGEQVACNITEYRNMLQAIMCDPHCTWLLYNVLMPAQHGNSRQYLTTNAAGSGTITSLHCITANIITTIICHKTYNLHTSHSILTFCATNCARIISQLLATTLNVDVYPSACPIMKLPSPWPLIYMYLSQKFISSCIQWNKPFPHS